VDDVEAEVEKTINEGGRDLPGNQPEAPKRRTLRAYTSSGVRASLTRLAGLAAAVCGPSRDGQSRRLGADADNLVPAESPTASPWPLHGRPKVTAP